MQGMTAINGGLGETGLNSVQYFAACGDLTPRRVETQRDELFIRTFIGPAIGRRQAMQPGFKDVTRLIVAA